MKNPFNKDPSQDEIDAFCRAVQHGDIAAISAAIDQYGAVIINKKDRNNNTALTWAAWDGHTDIVALLLEKGADVDDQESNGKTALICAAQRGDNAIVWVLIHNGAAIEPADKHGDTALKLATDYHQPGTAEIILAAQKKRIEDKRNQEEKKKQDAEKQVKDLTNEHLKKIKELRPSKPPLKKAPPKP